MPTWPSSLPAPRRSGYEEGPQDNTIGSQTDTGPGKVRRRFTAVADDCGFELRVTEDQLNTFINFHKNTLRSGTLPFTYTHPRTSDTVSARFKPKTPPRWTRVGGAYWSVSIKLEILP